jgi:hypothetical protein
VGPRSGVDSFGDDKNLASAEIRIPVRSARTKSLNRLLHST